MAVVGVLKGEKFDTTGVGGRAFNGLQAMSRLRLYGRVGKGFTGGDSKDHQRSGMGYAHPGRRGTLQGVEGQIPAQCRPGRRGDLCQRNTHAGRTNCGNHEKIPGKK